MPDYEVTDPNGIEYRPSPSSPPMHAAPGDTVSEADLTDVARDFLLRVGALKQKLDTAMSRDELDEQARDAGIADPEGLPTKAAVIDAIEGVTADA